MSQVHPLARTTPRTRTEIRCSNESAGKLADLYNISKATALKWKGRDDVLDRSHRAHDIGTTLSPAQSCSCWSCATYACGPWTTCSA